MMRTILCLLFLLSASGIALPAQQLAPRPTEVDSLSRVRVTRDALRPRRIAGELLFSDSAVLGLRSAGETEILPWFTVERIEVSIGRRSASESAWKGAKTGLLGGAAFSALLLGWGVYTDLHATGDTYVPATLVAAVLSVPLTGVTTLGGALIGAMAPRDRWKSVPAPVEVRSAPTTAVDGGR